MARIQIYTKSNCPFCVRAKALLDKKRVSYEEIDAESRAELRNWLAETTGQKTVPQIFVDGKPLGGFSDIDALDKQGRLDAVLAG